MKNSSSPSGKGLQRDLDKERFWRKALLEQVSSGIDVRAFCRERGLAEASFYAWRRTIARRDGENASPLRRDPPASFVELRSQSDAPVDAGVPLEIVVCDLRVLVRPGCDVAMLREVLTILGE